MPASLSNPSVERVRAALAAAGLAPDIVELPGAARTAVAAAQFLGCEVAQIANSLVFRAQSTDRAVLVMSSGAKRVSIAKLAATVGEPIGKADADFVRRHTGFAIGGVAPAGSEGAYLRAFVERGLSAWPDIWAAAGHPSTVFRLSYAELLRLTGGAEADLAE
ncbi:MAG: YbaK/EbsC family protein [Betaproteobacteria bacterium]|nr:YbaK/EbsC family protein [Betaproteobacteria bacterium]